MTYEDKQGLTILIWIFVLYLLRKHKPFDTIWEIVKLFLIIVLVICTAGLILKWIKNFFK